jgi:hypothetical protein
MTGIQFITDEAGRRTAAVIDLKKHKALWEDIEDVLVSRSRRHEKRIPLARVKADLGKSGKLRGCQRDRFSSHVLFPGLDG